MTLEQLDPRRCPDCTRPLATITFDEPALLRHGGYGATRHTEIRYCRCGWALVALTTETRPRR